MSGAGATVGATVGHVLQLRHFSTFTAAGRGHLASGAQLRSVMFASSSSNRTMREFHYQHQQIARRTRSLLLVEKKRPMMGRSDSIGTPVFVSIF